jgi:predicted TIM-barrel fold metal-dependent hydrolase
VYSGPIIDAHHHIWPMAELPWLAGPPVPRIFGEYGPIRRDYLIEEYLADARPAGVVGSVYVQANWRAGAEVEEVAWVQAAADSAHFPMGIVGFADLMRPDVGDLLDRESAYRGLRGIRQQLHWHENTLYRFASRSDLAEDPAWQRGLAQIARRGLVFELQVFAAQMAGAAQLVRDFPDCTFVLAHAGMLEDRSPEGWERWRRGMSELARCPNVVTKLSGLGTFVHACSEALWGPVVKETVDLFGPARCLFGSNFPIEKLWTTYSRLVQTTREVLAGLDDDEQRLVFYGNAARVYRLE